MKSVSAGQKREDEAEHTRVEDPVPATPAVRCNVTTFMFLEGTGDSFGRYRRTLTTSKGLLSSSLVETVGRGPSVKTRDGEGGGILSKRSGYLLDHGMRGCRTFEILRLEMGSV